MEQVLFNNELRLDIPDSFTSINSEKIVELWPMANHPDYMYISEDSLSYIIFTDTKTDISKELIPDVLAGIKLSMKRAFPANQLFDNKVLFTKEIDCGWFDYQGFSLQGELYYIYCVAKVKGKMKTITLHGPYDNKEELKLIFSEMIKGMKDITRQ